MNVATMNRAELLKLAAQLAPLNLFAERPDLNAEQLALLDDESLRVKLARCAADMEAAEVEEALRVRLEADVVALALATDDKVLPRPGMLQGVTLDTLHRLKLHLLQTYLDELI